MLTTDPLYYKPLLPQITIKPTLPYTTLYTYNSFTDTGTTDKVLYCSVSLSQNTHGEFTIQFEDQDKSLESTVTVGSRVLIDCGKQSTSLTRLISGLVRKKGYTRGGDNKILYTISGSSTGIRLNERLIYAVSEAALLPTGQIDLTDASRKADILLASGLSALTADGILSIANLAANSDVETFIASTNIQYGEFQDLVNYYEDQSGGEVIVDTNDLVSFRYEIKNNLFGRGFTIKNDNDNKANDDAADTMYLRGKSWSYEDDFYKSSNYGNRFYALFPTESDPIIDANLSLSLQSNQQAIAVKFRPTHTHYLPGDIWVALQAHTNSLSDPVTTTGNLFPEIRICQDAGGVPMNSNGVLTTTTIKDSGFSAMVESQTTEIIFAHEPAGFFFGQPYIDLDTTKDYWLILHNRFMVGSDTNPNTWWRWYQRSDRTAIVATNSNLAPSTNTNGGTGWNVNTLNAPWFEMPRRRSHSFVMWDPKAMQAVSTGLSAGLATDTLLTDAPHQVSTFDSMYRFMQQQTYNLARPRTTYSFPRVTAPNIPPFPGDPIVISDDILGFSTLGNQVILTTCGDMTYQWGNLGSGSYEAPTNLSIQAVGVHARYR